MDRLDWPSDEAQRAGLQQGLHTKPSACEFAQEIDRDDGPLLVSSVQSHCACTGTAVAFDDKKQVLSVCQHALKPFAVLLPGNRLPAASQGNDPGIIAPGIHSVHVINGCNSKLKRLFPTHLRCAHEPSPRTADCFLKIATTSRRTQSDGTDGPRSGSWGMDAGLSHGNPALSSMQSIQRGHTTTPSRSWR